MKYSLLTSMIVLWFVPLSNSQPIKPNFTGINLWMPHKVGNQEYVDPLSTIAVEDNYSLVQQAGTQIVRWGGSEIEKYENYGYINADYNAKILQVMTQIGTNVKIILQVPRPKNLNDLLSVMSADGVNYYFGSNTGGAQQAKDIVTAVEAYCLGIGFPKENVLWMIGNEPDRDDNLNFSGTTGTTADIATYVKLYAVKMREADPTITIIAPGLTSYRDYDQTVTQLTDKTATGLYTTCITGTYNTICLSVTLPQSATCIQNTGD